MISQRLVTTFGRKALWDFSIIVLRSRSQRRHLLAWLRSLRENYLLSAPSPWLAFDAIHFIETRLQPNPHIFEYGSGGSTLFWLIKGAKLVSVEHDIQWFETISRQVVGAQTITRLDYRIIPPQRAETEITDGQRADPTQYRSGDQAFRQYQFRDYVSQIDEFPADTFDLVMVDGRARPACIMHSASKIKPGGMLVLDNADRTYYLQNTGQWLKEFTCYSFYGVTPSLPGFTHTDVFVRNGR